MAKNGKTKAGTRTNDKRNSANAGRGLGGAAAQSQEFRTDPNTVLEADSTWENSGGNDRAGGAGGIIRQLRELRDEHLGFVDAHSDRLKARLADDERHRKQIIEKMDLLERQIMQFLEEPSESEESGEPTK